MKRQANGLKQLIKIIVVITAFNSYRLCDLGETFIFRKYNFGSSYEILSSSATFAYNANG